MATPPGVRPFLPESSSSSAGGHAALDARHILGETIISWWMSCGCYIIRHHDLRTKQRYNGKKASAQGYNDLLTGRRTRPVGGAQIML